MWSVHSVYTRVSVSECSLLGRYQKNASRDVLLWPPVSSAGILSPVRVVPAIPSIVRATSGDDKTARRYTPVLRLATSSTGVLASLSVTRTVRFDRIRR